MNEKEQLKPAEELFCYLYAGSGDYFNNATRAYGVAYERELPPIDKVKSDWTIEEKNEYHQAGVESHRLLKKAKIRQRCDEILLEEFKDDITDKELAWTLRQRDDLSAKMNAIREYNKLKQRITEKVEHSGGVDLKTIIINKSNGNGDNKSSSETK